MLYAFLISVLQGMAVTSEDELERLHEASARGERFMDTDDDASDVVSENQNTAPPNSRNNANNSAAATANHGTRENAIQTWGNILLGLVSDVEMGRAEMAHFMCVAHQDTLSKLQRQKSNDTFISIYRDRNRNQIYWNEATQVKGEV